MTIPNRLEALEKGQADILTCMGEVKRTLGRVEGTLDSMIADRGESVHLTELACLERHKGLDSRLSEHSKTLVRHEKRIKANEQGRMITGGKWSLAKTLVVAFISFVGLVATCVGILEAITHLTGG